MTLTQEQLEWIVAEVVRRLRAEPIATSVSNTTLTIEERLVTLATLRGRIDGIGSVRIAKSSIVTPAVVDELKARGIELVRS